MVGMPSSRILERLESLEILSPVDPDANSRWRLASRLQTIHGKTGGFLGNRKANADHLLKDVRELLEKDFELKDAVVMDKFVYSRPASDDIVNALADRCDFVVTAIAD